MQYVELTKGMQALVDDEDFERICEYSWHLLGRKNTLYASRTVMENGKKVNIMMHRLILRVNDKSLHVDHINGNGLDNRKENLRLVSRNQNMRNLNHKRSNNSSGYRGVCYDKNSGKWLSYIYVNSKQIKLGRFSEIKDAALAFDKAAKELFGPYCGKLNFD